jgi:CRP/FNR family transcriptional regulator
MDGREHTMRILHKSESFNLVPALMKAGENLANARCLSKSALLVVGRKDLNSILSRFPHFAVHVLQVMANRLAGMTKLVGELALLTVRQRTAAFLIREAENASMKKGRNWTQDEMARQIGTVRDVIGRILRDFEKKGYIHRIKGNISLIDREGLERTEKGRE